MSRRTTRVHAAHQDLDAPQSSSLATASAKARRTRSGSSASQILSDSSNHITNIADPPDDQDMSATGVRKRHRIVEEDDEESYDGGRPTRKRASVANGHARGGAVETDEEEAESVDGQDSEADDDLTHESSETVQAGEANNEVVPSAVPRVRSSNGYLAGSIVRVKLENFVTYDAVEFRPGPHLNMIVGPNGTGKSTIVCAIALGLGWNPQLLGRAKEVASFVKEGAESGSIEVELERVGKPNLVIRRLLDRHNNRSEFYLSKKKVSASTIKEEVDALGIDVSNLCCFLPQDRVAHFAQMDSTELLKETQKAAGQKNMTDWHNALIEFGSQQLKLAQELNEKESVAVHLDENLQNMQRDVERFQERQRLETQVKALDIAYSVAGYKESKSVLDQLKDERKKLMDELEKRETQLQPLSERMSALEDEEKQHKLKVDQITRALKRDAPLLQKANDDLEQFERESQRVSEKLDRMRVRDKDSKRVIRDLQRLIDELKEKVQNEPPRPETEVIDRKIRELREESRGIKAENDEANAENQEIVRRIRRLDEELNAKRQELAKLDNVGHLRLKMLEQNDHDTFLAVNYVRANSNLFKEPVLGPVLLEVSIKDPRMASAVESCITWPMLKTFVCQNQEDYDLFGRMMDRQKLRVNFCDRGQTKALDGYRRPTTQEELESMGFDKYAIDLIEAPDIILRYLCSDAHFHTIPVALNERSVDIQAVERSDKFKRYITGRYLHTISYSNYGSRRAQTLTRNLRPPRTFSQSVDQNQRRALDDGIRAINEQKANAEQRTRAMMNEGEERSRRLEQLRQEGFRLEQRKGEVIKAYSAWEKAKVDLATREFALQAELSKPSIKVETKENVEKLDRLHDKCAKTLLDIKTMLSGVVSKREQSDLQQLETLACQQRLVDLQKLKNEQEGQFNDIQNALERMNAEYAKRKAEAQTALRKARAMLEEASASISEEFRRIEQDDRPTESLLDELNRTKARLEMSIGVSSGVLEEYNRRKRLAENSKEEIARVQREKEKVDKKVQKLKDHWYPALKQLVGNVNAKFSAAFRRIGNAGEVRIVENENYDKWGIEILVKFRDTEQLQQLNAHRQSGGERSISTITYLLSLTEMSRAPFSLVDEINQGMDQKYERQVHDHMVSVTCENDHAGQYFLITPKLLQNLHYHERMRVLTINNGEWLPDTFSFHYYIDKAKKRLAEGNRTSNTLTAVHG